MDVTLALPIPPRYASASPDWLSRWLREQRKELVAEFGRFQGEWVEVWREVMPDGYTERAWVITVKKTS